MKWNELISLRISELVARQLAKSHQVQIKGDEESLRKRVEQTVRSHFEQERQLVDEVYQMMEDLESQGHRFERRKMFPLLKAKLAKQKGFIL